MFMNFLEAGRLPKCIYRRSWKLVEHSVKSQKILEYLEPLRKFKKFMKFSGLSYFWHVKEHLKHS